MIFDDFDGAHLDDGWDTDFGSILDEIAELGGFSIVDLPDELIVPDDTSTDLFDDYTLEDALLD